MFSCFRVTPGWPPRGGHYSQAVSAAEAEGGQPAPHAADLTIPRRVAESPLPVDDRQRVGTALDHGEKGAAQIKHGPGSTNIAVAAFVAAAQKPSQEEVLPTRSALYLGLLGASKCLVRQRVVASAASVSCLNDSEPFARALKWVGCRRGIGPSQAASPTVAAGSFSIPSFRRPPARVFSQRRPAKRPAKLPILLFIEVSPRTKRRTMGA